MATRKFGALAGIAIAGALGTADQAFAISGPAPYVDTIEVGTSRDGTEGNPGPIGSWEGAQDENGLGNPGLGVPAGVDWYGTVYQRVAGTGGVPASPDGSLHVLELDLTHVPELFFRGGRDSDGLGGSSYVTATTDLKASVDFYLNPAMPYGGDHGPTITDFWWSNGVGDITYYGFYLTETGISVRREADGTFNFFTTNNVFIANIPDGSWVTLNTEFYEAPDGKLAAHHYVTDISGATVYGNVDLTTLFFNQDASNVSGPRYQQYFFGDPGNTGPGNLYTDNNAWELVAVPEPGTLALLGLAGLATLRRRRIEG